MNYLFIHVPKTGGTSIRQALGGPRMRTIHARAKYCVDLTPFSFAFIRNPWDRILSYYCMSIRGRQWNQAAWEKLVREDIPPQTEYICDDHGNILINFVGRYENLEADFHTVCQRLGRETPPLYRLNSSEHSHYHSYYDESTKQVVANKYATEIEMFNYVF